MASVIATERSATIRELSEALAAERRATVEDVSQSIATERVALFAELDARQTMLQGTASEVRAGLADADKLAVTLHKTTSSVNEALINADKLMARFDLGSNGADSASEPFDINSYVNAIQELTVAIREANTLLLSTERLTGGESAMAGIFDRVLWTGTILILILCVAVFITMLIYRAAARHIVARSSFDPVDPPADKSK
jgi:flagellar hook-basal body complex protein FliE